MRMRGPRHLAAAGVAACLLTAGIAAAGAGQGTGIGLSLPGSATLGPPDWVTLGTRLSFYAAGASVANAAYQWQESDDGAWQDPLTGKRYAQVDAPTASGEGIFQMDVVGFDGPDVAVQWVLYGLDRPAGRFFGGSGGGARELGSAPEDFWIHPDLLAAVPAADLPDLKILRGPYAANDTTYAGLAILNPDPNAYSSLIYDLATGVLLSTTTRTQGNASPLHVEGQDPPDANTQITIGRYLGTRQRDGSALTLPLPDWTAPGATLAYAGTWTFVNPYDPSRQAVTYPAQLVVTLEAGGPSWRGYRSAFDVNIGGLPSHVDATGVATGAGPWWIAPEALAALSAGDVLDVDPVTGQRLTVTAADADTVTVTSAVPGLPATSVYDTRSGVLLAITRTEEGSGLTTALQLQAMP